MKGYGIVRSLDLHRYHRPAIFMILVGDMLDNAQHYNRSNDYIE